MVTLTYRPFGTGVAGHIQPSFEFRWDYAKFGAISERYGYDASFPCPLSDHVHHIVCREPYKDLGAFYQGQEPWAWPHRMSDLPPTSGNGWFLFEFWTRDLAGVEACLDALVANLKEHKVPIEVVRIERDLRSSNPKGST